MNYLPNHLVDSVQQMVLLHLDASVAFDMEEWKALRKMVAEVDLEQEGGSVVYWEDPQCLEGYELVVVHNY